MKKIIFVLISLSLFLLTLTAEDFGSAGALNQQSYTLEEMLRYGLEDEHMALAEYEAIMETWNVTRPYSNIIRSEETHIDYLENLYTSLNIQIPDIDTRGMEVLPSSLTEAAEIGVEAEIANIAMYEQFLQQDLPEDVEEVFTLLKNASENHLRAFENQLNRTVSFGNTGRGRR